MLISDQLREQNANIACILFNNLNTVNELYLDVMANNIGEEETGDESHSVICTMASVLLMGNKTKFEAPIEYAEEDEPLIAKIAANMACLLSLEDLHEKGELKRKIVDGSPVYTGGKIKEKKNVRRSKT